MVNGNGIGKSDGFHRVTTTKREGQISAAVESGVIVRVQFDGSFKGDVEAILAERIGLPIADTCLFSVVR